MRKITISIFFVALLSFSNGFAQKDNCIVGNWKDSEKPSKIISIALNTDGTFTGKSDTGKIVLKDLVWDKKKQRYQGLLLPPDDKEEFKISIQCVGDEFNFKIKRYFFTKKFLFQRFNK